MRYYRIVIAYTLMCCMSCHTDKSSQRSVYFNHHYPVTEIHFDTTIIQKRVSEVIDSVGFIALETNANSIIGEIAMMEVYKDYIVVLDDIGLGIVIFSADGKFLAKIEQPYKNAKGKFKQFVIDRNKGEIVVYDSYQAKFLYYDFNGKLLRIRDIPFSFSGFALLSGSYVFFSGYSPFFSNGKGAVPIKTANDSCATLLYADDAFKTLFNKESLFNLNAVDNLNTFSNERDFFTIDARECLFSHSYSNKIFQLSDKGIKRIFEIQIPPSLMYPQGYLDNRQYKNVRISNTREKGNAALFWSITDPFLIDSTKMLVNIKNEIYPVNYYLFDLQYNTSLSLSAGLTYDSTSGFLPLTESRFYASGRDGIYGFISAEFLLDLARDEKAWDLIKKNPALNKTLERLNNLSNGVITKVYFKKDLSVH